MVLDLLVKLKQVVLDVGCPATSFCLSSDLLLAFGAERVWILSAEQQESDSSSGLRKLETWHHDAEDGGGDLQDVAKGEESALVVMSTTSGKMHRRWLHSDSNRRRDAAEKKKKNGSTKSAATTVALAAICKERPDLSVSVMGERMEVESHKGAFSAVLAQLEDEDLRGATRVRWQRQERIFVLASSDRVVRVYSFEEEEEGGGARLLLDFCHDGHRVPVTDFAPHPTAPRLNFSSDERGCLHAWAFCVPSKTTDV